MHKYTTRSIVTSPKFKSTIMVVTSQLKINFRLFEIVVVIASFRELFDEDQEDENDVLSSIILLSDAVSKIFHFIRMFCF